MWLAQMMLLGGTAFVAWIMCCALGYKQIGQMIILIAVFTAINLTVQVAKPYYDEAKAKVESVGKQVDDTKKTLDKAGETAKRVQEAKEKLTGESFKEKLDRFLWGDERKER